MTDMDWTGDKNSVFMTLGASNHTDKEREKDDFYATEPRAIDALVTSPVGMSLPEKVWECACGTGTLSERLEYFGYNVVSSDLVNRGYGQTVDFLECREMPQDCKCIITNPPYKYALEFVKHGIELLSEGGLCIMFLKTQFLEGQKRWKEIYSSTPPKWVLQFRKRILCAKNGRFEAMRKAGGSAVSYAWFVWEKGYTGKTMVDWIG